MSAADNAKPPRPCTEYNIFFQLERAYILQVLLQTESAIDDGTDVFHPSQASYAGLPALPPRYASLVLPYDWHLPGKERRRRRKHRKSHGAIGFHELSAGIVNAWKVADEGVKAYCSRVCAARLARYRDAVKERKRNGGREQGAPRKKNGDIKVMAENLKKSVQEPQEINGFGHGEKKKEEDASSIDLDFKAFLHDWVQNEAPVPTPVTSKEVTSGEISQVFDNDIVLTGEEDALGMWDTQGEPFLLEPASFVGTADAVPFNAFGIDIHEESRIVNDGQVKDKVLRNASIDSIETVDIDDDEIISMWNSCDDIPRNHQHCYYTTSVVSAASTFNATSLQSANNSKTEKYDSLFGLKGYAQTMQDMQRMKLMLDEQGAQLAKARRPARRCSIVARCA